MSMEMRNSQDMLQKAPKRVFDTMIPAFVDYGYRSPSGAINSIRAQLSKSSVPVLISIVGPSKNGKEHILRDIASKLGVPSDVVYWGNAFSVAKEKGLLPKERRYGEISADVMNVVTDEYEGLIQSALLARQGQAAVIFVKGILLTGARIDGEFQLVNRGFTAFENIAKRKGLFGNLNFVDYWFGVAADPQAVVQGGGVRARAEALLEQPAELVQGLENSGESLLISENEFRPEDYQNVIDYISESANIAASDEIRFLRNALASRLIEAKKGEFGSNWQYWQRQCYMDSESQVCRFLGLEDEMKATAGVLRYIFEENFDIKHRVFIGLTQKLDKIVFDLRGRPDIVAYRNFPKLRDIKNK